MDNKEYLVLSSSSLGYTLYDFSKKENIICRVRNKIFYHSDTSVKVGDIVYLDDKDNIIKIKERKNQLKRPNVSNIDLACLIISSKRPDFSSYLLDKYLTINNYYKIPSLILISKKDLLTKKEKDELEKRMDYYRKLHYDVIFIDCYKKDEDFNTFTSLIYDKKICLIGQTGVGKSSLINLLDSSINREVDKNDNIIGRGRHTTKEVKIFKTDFCFIYDTPGFSSFDIDYLKPKDISVFFPGYDTIFNRCYFNNCLHEKEKGCEVIKQVDEGYLSFDSYENYLKILKEVKSFDVWKKKI